MTQRTITQDDRERRSRPRVPDGTWQTALTSIAANSISVAPWIVCVRSGATEQSRQRVYSVFFREGKVSSIQASAIVDRCEAQNFVPLPASTAPVQTAAAKGSRSIRP